MTAELRRLSGRDSLGHAGAKVSWFRIVLDEPTGERHFQNGLGSAGGAPEVADGPVLHFEYSAKN